MQGLLVEGRCYYAGKVLWLCGMLSRGHQNIEGVGGIVRGGVRVAADGEGFGGSSNYVGSETLPTSIKERGPHWYTDRMITPPQSSDWGKLGILFNRIKFIKGQPFGFLDPGNSRDQGNLHEPVLPVSGLLNPCLSRLERAGPLCLGGGWACFAGLQILACAGGRLARLLLLLLALMIVLS
eukprot:1150959-Pelagomonas_calceolata.AAC.1